MCTNATKTAANLMLAIEPTLTSFLNLLGVGNTPAGLAAIAAFDTAQKAVAAWVPGSTSQDVIQVLDAFETVFSALPVPAEAKTLADLIIAGVVTVIGVITGNSPAPVAAPADATASDEEVQAGHAIATAKATEARVQTLVPGFKRLIWHSAASQYKSQWNKSVAALGGKYAGLKQ
jgi:hypothetical protein